MSAAIEAARSPLLSELYAVGQWFSALQMSGTNFGGAGRALAKHPTQMRSATVAD